MLLLHLCVELEYIFKNLEAEFQEFKFKQRLKASNIVCSTKNCIEFFKIQAAAQFRLVFGEFETRLKGSVREK